jgi:ABC-2 type transport system permease protein
VLLEGAFPSYFEGKPIPVREGGKDAEATADEAPAASAQAPAVKGVADTGAFIAKSRPARIIVMASAEMLTDKILDPEGRTPNSIFVLNAIDHLNGRDDVARLRSKEQRFNPLDPVAPETRALVKAANIAGLPILAVGFGLLVWLRRSRRKARIQTMFQQESQRP